MPVLWISIYSLISFEGLNIALNRVETLRIGVSGLQSWVDGGRRWRRRRRGKRSLRLHLLEILELVEGKRKLLLAELYWGGVVWSACYWLVAKEGHCGRTKTTQRVVVSSLDVWSAEVCG